MSSLILAEGIDDVDTLKNLISEHDNPKIISFDFLAHKSLKSLNIPHAMVEEYCSNIDEQNIDQKALEIGTLWHRHAEFSDLIEYEGLNLGSLLNLEMPEYFCTHLKRIVGLIRIIEKENPSKIITASLGSYVKVVCANKKIEVISLEKKIISTVIWDRVEIPVTIKGKTFTVRMSRNNFLHLKKFIETFVNSFFHLKPNLKKIQKPILVLDFNTVTYEELIKSLSNLSQDIILLNQRRPAIWNLESLKIIRNSKCKILRLEDLATSDVISFIEKEQERMKKKLDIMWDKQDVLEDYFSIFGISFWIPIKNSFIEIISKRFEESIKRYILFKILFENIDIGSILEWAHVSMEEKIVLHLANKKTIPVIFLQHGLYILNKKLEKYLPFFPILPSNGAREAIWGNIMKDYAKTHNVNDNDTVITGSPRHDIFFKNRTSLKNSGNILIAANSLFYVNFSGKDARAYEYLEDNVREIFRVLKKFPDKKPIVKLHPAHSYYDIKPLIHEIDSTISIYQDQNVLNMLTSCDAMISLNYSTVLLDAMILNKPTMIILPDKQDFHEELPITRKATLYVDQIEKIESSINDLLFNKDIREGLIRRGKEFVDDYFSNQGKASDFLASTINNMNKTEF